MDASALDNSISTLEKSISSLESSVDSLDFWLWASTAAVVIGVAAEVYFVVHEHVSAREAWQRGSIRSPDRPSTWLFGVELLSIILVVLGVAGELVVGIVSSRWNADLRNQNNRLVALVREKASNAAKSAGDANREAGQARKEAASTDLKAGQLDKEAASLRQKAEDEAKAREDIEERFAWRRLDQEEQRAIGFEGVKQTV
jgi:hypothetical protein